MPHIIIEKSQDISYQETLEFLTKIQEEMSRIEGGNFSVKACKGRIIEFENYVVGTKNQNSSSFLHVTIKILEGRTREIKINLAKKIAEISTNFLESQSLGKENKDLSVDIVDMNKDCYQKISL